jgi:hypothetical protein
MCMRVDATSIHLDDFMAAPCVCVHVCVCVCVECNESSLRQEKRLLET